MVIKLTLGQLFADKVAGFVGSWTFIILQSTVLAAWIILNISGLVSFDPYPFILLNLFLSFQAAYTGPFVMMSQGRQSEIDRQTMEADYAADVTAVAEIQAMRVEVGELREMIEKLLHK